jgi:hypothetical protein
MGELGALAPFGLLTFGAEPSRAEPHYRSMENSVRDAWDVSEGTHVEASIYARSIALAAARATLRHALDQRRPMLAVEMLSALEDTFGVTPTPGESDDARRRDVAARKLIARGSAPAALAAALSTLLGNDFVKVVTSPRATFPTSPGDVGAWDDPAVPPRLFVLTSSVSSTGPVTFSYASQLGDSARLHVGDRMAVQIENPLLAEAVTITAADEAASTATATFTHAHDLGASVRSHAPLWTSTQRHLVVIVSASAANDALTRARIDALMTRLVRATTTWSIAQASGPTTLGPFTVGVSPIGSVPIGTVTIG